MNEEENNDDNDKLHYKTNEIYVLKLNFKPRVSSNFIKINFLSHLHEGESKKTSPLKSYNF